MLPCSRTAPSDGRTSGAGVVLDESSRLHPQCMEPCASNSGRAQQGDLQEEEDDTAGGSDAKDDFVVKSHHLHVPG